jgi:hypothetical protein
MSARLLLDRTHANGDPKLRLMAENIWTSSNQMRIFIKSLLANAAADRGFKINLETIDFSAAVTRSLRQHDPSSTVKAGKRGVLRGKAFFKSQNVVTNSNTVARFLLAQVTALAHLRRGKERRLCIFESNAPVLMPTCKSWRVFATRARFISGS